MYTHTDGAYLQCTSVGHLSTNGVCLQNMLVTRAGLTGSLFVLPLASRLQKQSGAEGWGTGSEGLPTKCLLSLPAPPPIITHHPNSPACQCLFSVAFHGVNTQAEVASQRSSLTPPAHFTSDCLSIESLTSFPGLMNEGAIHTEKMERTG